MSIAQNNRIQLDLELPVSARPTLAQSHLTDSITSSPSRGINFVSSSQAETSELAACQTDNTVGIRKSPAGRTITDSYKPDIRH